MRVKLVPLVLTALAATVLGLPGQAAAKPGYVRIGSTFALSARLPRSSGYRLELSAPTRRQIQITAQRGEVSATYRAPARIDDALVASDLGRFGHVDARLRHTRLVRRIAVPKGCHGKPLTARSGVLLGSIRFRGRQGFARAAVSRANALVVHRPPLVCRSGRPAAEAAVAALEAGGKFGVGLRPEIPGGSQAGGEEEPPEEVAVLAASPARSHGRRAFVAAVGTGGKFGFGLTLAGTQRHFGRVTAGTAALSFSESLAVSEPGEHPTTATLFGVAPFGGEATYSGKGPARRRWLGDLHVSLPGEGVVPLAGRGFHSLLCHGRSIPPRKLQHCLEAALPQASGSQSQSLLDTRLSWSR